MNPLNQKTPEFTLSRKRPYTPPELFLDKTITLSMRRVYDAINYLGYRTGKCWAQPKKIAEFLSLDVDNVRHTLAAMVTKQLIIKSIDETSGVKTYSINQNYGIPSVSNVSFECVETDIFDGTCEVTIHFKEQKYSHTFVYNKDTWQQDMHDIQLLAEEHATKSTTTTTNTTKEEPKEQDDFNVDYFVAELEREGYCPEKLGLNIKQAVLQYVKKFGGEVMESEVDRVISYDKRKFSTNALLSKYRTQLDKHLTAQLKQGN